MAEIKLDVQIRKEIGTRKIKKLARESFVPGIVYGGKQKPTPIQVDRKVYERIMRQHHGENVLFHISVLEGDKKLRDYSVIVKEEQLDPVTDRILHIDFNRISLTEKIEVKVAIEAQGEPIGVKQGGGTLEHVLWEIPVVCLPTQIPQHLIIEVGHLELNQSVYISDIKFPEGVTTKVDPKTIILSVVPPMKEEVVVEGAEIAPTEVEVIKEKKPEEKAAKKAEGEAAKAEEKEKK